MHHRASKQNPAHHAADTLPAGIVKINVASSSRELMPALSMLVWPTTMCTEAACNGMLSYHEAAAFARESDCPKIGRNVVVGNGVAINYLAAPI